jgi:hypothetical protein
MSDIAIFAGSSGGVSDLPQIRGVNYSQSGFIQYGLMNYRSGDIGRIDRSQARRREKGNSGHDPFACSRSVPLANQNRWSRNSQRPKR